MASLPRTKLGLGVLAVLLAFALPAAAAPAQIWEQ